MTKELYFVYGTLKYGGSNWSWLLKDQEFVGEAVTADEYLLVTCGYPYMGDPKNREEERKPVYGHLFNVEDPDVVRDLDRLEGVPTHFNRNKIKVIHNGEEVEAVCYQPVNAEDCMSTLPVCDTNENNQYCY